MQSYFQFLQDVYERPGMYVGSVPTQGETLLRVELVLIGFELREEYSDNLIPTAFNTRFREYVASVCPDLEAVGVIGVSHALLHRHTDPVVAWTRFFQLVAGFSYTHGYVWKM